MKEDTLQTILQLERETKEAKEFIELLKDLSRDELNEVKGYMKCLRTVRIITNIGQEKS